MTTPPQALSWFGPIPSSRGSDESSQIGEFVRLWRGFMTARVTLGLVLLALQAVLYGLGQTHHLGLVIICGVYFAESFAVRLFYPARRLGKTFDPQWSLTIGVDLVIFGALQFVQGSSVNYAPLLALPVLLASVLGSLPLALGTASGVTLILLSNAIILSLDAASDVTPLYAQAALTGTGSFAIAILANQLSMRLATEEQRSQSSLLAVRVQLEVNDLVIESLTDGVLVIDSRGLVHAANPAARHLLGAQSALQQVPFELGAEIGWQALLHLTTLSFSRHDVRQADVAIHHTGQGPRHVRVKTQLTAPHGETGESLCVMFLQDQRELEARMRSAKLASMGRMSAAVAHEIRNPLAAIVQANALLNEDLSEPKQRQLTQMVQQNARRLEKIVEDVLNISRVQGGQSSNTQFLDLDASVARICRDWAQQNGCPDLLGTQLSRADVHVIFELEHLRRVLVNLLDNALRYATGRPQSIQVSTRSSATGKVILGVWSDGQPLEQSVERHLFEPFFSSESRSSGLGLYICRELCEGHGASMAYQRTSRNINSDAVLGNEFLAVLRPVESLQQPGLF